MAHRLAVAVGGLEAWLVWIVASGCVCAMAAQLLRFAPVGEVTWRNRVAGWIFALLDDGDRSLRIMFRDGWLIWIYLGSMVIYLTSLDWNPPEEVVVPWPSVAQVLAVCSWTVNLMCLVQVLRVMALHYSRHNRRPMILLVVVVILAFATAASSRFYKAERMWSAALAGWAPLLALAALISVLALIFFLRERRWN